MGQFGMGQPVRRSEDQRFLTGHGRYLEDISLPGEAYAVVLRSPVAAARIAAIDAAEARKLPGVFAVLTAHELEADKIGGLPCGAPVKNSDGSMCVLPPRALLQGERVRHVGDPVAFVIAETLAAARDAAELVQIDYEELPSTSSTAGAIEPGAALVWGDAPANLCFDWEAGNKDKTDAAFARAARIVTVELVNNRIVPNSMEARGAIAAYDKESDRYTLYTTSQGSHTLQGVFAENVLNIPKEKLRVVTPDVGGGFGMKIFPYPEQGLALWAARRVGRPVKWMSERAEAFLSDSHGRDNVTRAELALDKDGHFLGLRVETIANLGAYLSYFAPFVATAAGVRMLAGVYRFEGVHVRVKGVFTNTVPVDAYRGAGRPEANYVVERIVDAAARELGIGPDELRRRNFIPPEAMPYVTAMDLTYDSGEFAANMDIAIERADWAGFAARRAESLKQGKRRGIGMATYIEACGGGGDERGYIKFDPEGGVTILIGTQSNGQGHETAYAQLAADRLGVEFGAITVLQGDTDLVDFGRGTGGSRSIPVGGAAVVASADKLIEKGKLIAAHAFEASEQDIEFNEGIFAVAGTDRRMPIGEVARAAFDPTQLPPGMEPGFEAKEHFKPSNYTFPNGCHICELEIEEATGEVEILRYTVVDDFGVTLNPLMLAGQVHGGVAQGVGQALQEHVVYDPESGQLLSGSFMDYQMPRAVDFPPIDFTTHNVPCRSNPLGVKGAGEAGAIGAPPAVINAVIDALAPLGLRQIDMPATSERIWRAISDAKAKAR
jgi:carbon-monoxide dehydrogenase large subunit